MIDSIRDQISIVAIKAQGPHL